MPGPANVAAPGVQVTNNGIEITDGTNVRATLGLLTPGTSNYGLRVISSNGTTVIVDGSSDVFKIAATGTMTTPNVGGTPAKGILTVTLTTNMSYLPATLFFVLSSDATANTSELCPNQIISNAGAIVFEYEGWVGLPASGTTTTRLVAQTFATTAGGGGTAATYRYYLLQEISF